MDKLVCRGDNCDASFTTKYNRNKHERKFKHYESRPSALIPYNSETKTVRHIRANMRMLCCKCHLRNYADIISSAQKRGCGQRKCADIPLFLFTCVPFCMFKFISIAMPMFTFHFSLQVCSLLAF